MTKSKVIKAAVILLPIFAAAAAFLLLPLVPKIAELLPPCTIHLYTGLLCPGCGNTRAVTALADFDLITSVRYNPIPLICVILAALYYTELVLYVFGKHKKLVPRKWSFWLIFVILFLIYCVVRNFIPWLSIA